jgi:hypothetical protein
MDPLISVLTVHGGWSPFRQIQERNLARFTDLPVEHLVADGVGAGSQAHGQMLDRLLVRASGNIIVTLDSDAFPVAAWTHLLAYLKTYEAVGIPHPRGYAHPSFFATRREHLEGLSFARQDLKDVGENLKMDALLLPLTGWDQENPIPGEPPLGAVYANCLYHQWYTTRADLEGDPDGIPGDLIRASVERGLAKWG